MSGKNIFYAKIIVSQLGAYLVSLMLVQKVFLGPAPIIRTEFVHEVTQLPQTTKEFVVTVPARISSFVAEIKIKRKLGGVTPPPWVFDPNPVGTYPINEPRPTGGDAPRNPGDNNPPGSPDLPPDRTPTQSRIEPTQSYSAPTRAPAPTRRPAEPTNAPASPSTLEKQTVDLINQRRSAAGLSVLAIDGHLTDAARNQSQYMSSGRGRCGHVGANGSSPMDRIKTAGYGGQFVGETVACGYTTAQTTVDGWWSSPPHKAILLTNGARHIGLGWSNNYQTAVVGR